MAAEQFSQQTQVLPPQPPKPGDDPKLTISEILKVVEALQNKVASSQILKTAKSTGSEITNIVSQTNDQQPPRLETSQSAQPGFFRPDDNENSVPKLQRNLRLLKEDVIKLQELHEDVGDEVRKHFIPLVALSQSSNTQLTKGMKKDLEDINKKIFNLMCQVPLLPNKRKKQKGMDSEDGDVINQGRGIRCLQAIHANEEELKRLAVFRQVKDKFMKLDNDRKICLLSFAVFPENREVNRTMLMYWWLGEGYLNDNVKPEDDVKDILKEFTDKNLIELVKNKRKVEPNCYKMTPFVHSSVVLISHEIKLYDIYCEGRKPMMQKSKLNKVCLVESSSSQQEAKAKKMIADDIETVFNVSERFPDFTFKWFSEEQQSHSSMSLSKSTYKKLKVFYLGRWERTAKRHIEVENPELMKYLRYMTKLKLLSFQGISRIERLDNAVCKLHELIILDLRACYNLEKLPDKIDSLKNLIYLDITDCYMIDRMPKRLSWLEKLEVLKGFVVSDADEKTVCTLVELSHLKNLRKLSITINKGKFGVAELIEAIEGFPKLEKLKVAWGGINERPELKQVKKSSKKQEKAAAATGATAAAAAAAATAASAAAATKENAGGGVKKAFGKTMSMFIREKNKVNVNRQLPKTLKKLDLQCFPDAVLPPWLEPQNLGDLEKLYIKGGTKLTGFGQIPVESTQCKVKILRLKFLPRLKVEWTELRELYFPNLIFLEKYQCPQVSFCPCDGIGIWRNT